MKAEMGLEYSDKTIFGAEKFFQKPLEIFW